MTPEAGLAAVRLALFLILGALLVLIWTPRDSAEFVVLVLTLGVGVLMLATVAVLARLGSWPREDDRYEE